MLLADELVDGTWPHFGGKRPSLAAIVVADVVEDVDEEFPHKLRSRLERRSPLQDLNHGFSRIRNAKVHCKPNPHLATVREPFADSHTFNTLAETTLGAEVEVWRCRRGAVEGLAGNEEPGSRDFREGRDGPGSGDSRASQSPLICYFFFSITGCKVTITGVRIGGMRSVLISKMRFTTSLGLSTGRSSMESGKLAMLMNSPLLAV